MNYKMKDRIISAIAKGDTLFIKGTGVRVTVDYFGVDCFTETVRGKKVENCHLEFIDTPTTECLKLCSKYDIKKNSHTKEIEVSGVIDIRKLSLRPYESKAGKLLYEK